MVNMLEWSREVEELINWYDTDFELTVEKSLTVEESKSLTEFTLFPEFPEEIQLMIYGHMMPNARIIEVLWNKDKGYYTDCPNPVPIPLHICAKSRLFALEKVKPVEIENFLKDDRFIRMRQEKSLAFYVNPAIDTLYLSMGNSHVFLSSLDAIADFLRKLNDDVAASIQRIAMDAYRVDHILDENLHDGDRKSPPLVSRFPQLKGIGMIISDVCMCTAWNNVRNFAPRREPLKFADHETTVVKFTKWSSTLGVPVTRPAGRHFDVQALREWRYNIRMCLVRDFGSDQKWAFNFQLPLLGIVRGDESWDGYAEKQAKIFPETRKVDPTYGYMSR